MSTCECGCGQEITYKPYHRKYGTPRFISGHNSKLQESREKSSERLKKLHSEGRAFSLFRKGRIPWNKDKKGVQVAWNKGLKYSGGRLTSVGKKLSENKERSKKIGLFWKGRPKSVKSKKKLKKRWQNKEFREKQIRATLKAMFKRPTGLEQKAIELHAKYNLPFTYCGDGDLIIGGKNPDFYENNGKKICLEYGSKRQREAFGTPWQEYERKRIKHFAKYGWKCLVIWAEELNDNNKLVEKIGGILDG